MVRMLCGTDGKRQNEVLSRHFEAVNIESKKGSKVKRMDGETKIFCMGKRRLMWTEL